MVSLPLTTDLKLMTISSCVDNLTSPNLTKAKGAIKILGIIDYWFYLMPFIEQVHKKLRLKLVQV